MFLVWVPEIRSMRHISRGCKLCATAKAVLLYLSFDYEDRSCGAVRCSFDVCIEYKEDMAVGMLPKQTCRRRRCPVQYEVTSPL